MNDGKNIVYVNDIFSKRKKMKHTIQFKMTLHHSSFIKGLKYNVPNRIENGKKGVFGEHFAPRFFCLD
jgi:hypothetical protein